MCEWCFSEQAGAEEKEREDKEREVARNRQHLNLPFARSSDYDQRETTGVAKRGEGH
jgi:hypothetical protein